MIYVNYDKHFTQINEALLIANKWNESQSLPLRCRGFIKDS